MPFRLPTRVIIAAGCLNQIGEVAQTFPHREILLVVDDGLMQTRWPDVALKELSKLNTTVRVAENIEPNPRSETVDIVAEDARSAGVQLVIGLGGGSVLDAAKAVAMLLKNDGGCLDYEGKNRFKNGSMPFIAVPTTCGTGSEVTWVSVISSPAEARKASIKGDAMFPDVALVDPDVLETLPAHLIAATGMDALTHALEAYTVNCGNPVSDALAEQAIRLLFNNLPVLVQDTSNQEARFQVMRASTLSGMAFGNADVGAVHCLSETIGGIWDVPHGLANAMLLAPVMRFHEPVIRDRLIVLERLLSPEKSADKATGRAFVERLLRLGEALKIPEFKSLEIPVDAYARIAAGAVANNSNGSNPQLMNVEAYLAILSGLNR